MEGGFTITHNILNKFILFLGVLTILLFSYTTEKVIIPILMGVVLAAIIEFFSREKITLRIYLIYLAICLIKPEFFLVLPLIIYDVFVSKYQYIAFLAIIPWIVNLQSFELGINFVVVAMIAISFILKYKAIQYKKLHDEYISKRDELMEMSINLEKKVEDLMVREDFQVNLSTLNERNRIAREIHDNVGHLLTSSILQLGAVMTLSTEESTKAMLTNIKNTLDEGMYSIRNSVHDLHENSIDLYVQLTNIVHDFEFCEVNLNYEISTELDIKVKYAAIAIVKEALANIIKHSNASKVSINLYEHPRLYQLIIADNGTKKKIREDNGMGLEGIRNRVSTLGGIVNFDQSNGFKIFISFMKEV